MKSSKPMLVCFKADKFNSTIAKDYFINPSCFGDDVCMWLISEFTTAGCRCDEKPEQEDFGWYFNIYPGKAKHTLICGYQNDNAVVEEEIATANASAGKTGVAEGEAPRGKGNWLVWIEHPTNFISSLLGGANKNIDFELLKLLQKILSESADVSDIRWFTKDDFDSGDESRPQDPPA